jgi:hypothetical protein
LPLRIGLRRGGVSQAVYTNTRDGDMPGVVPFLKSFGAQPIEVAVTDIVSGKSAVGSTG